MHGLGHGQLRVPPGAGRYMPPETIACELVSRAITAIGRMYGVEPDPPGSGQSRSTRIMSASRYGQP